jgi:hypothetical protein
MLLIALAVLFVALVPVAGGDLRGLARIELRRPGAALAGLAVQVVVTNVIPGADHTLLSALHVASYGLAGWFVAVNVALPGILPMAAGGALNLLAIVANGGVMPASAWAVARSGLDVGDGYANSAVLADPRLLALGDIIPVPVGPLANVLSVGDLVVFAGLALLLARACRRPSALPALAPGDAVV